MILLDDIHRDFQVGDQMVHALDGINVSIDTGEYIAITGPSGSGKSTLLNLLGLLDRPSEGTYSLDGTDVTRLSDEQQAHGAVVGAHLDGAHIEVTAGMNDPNPVGRQAGVGNE